MNEKIPKVVAQYFPPSVIERVGMGIGTRCDRCRDFIKFSSECMVVSPSNVSGPSGTCCLFVGGQPHDAAKPLLLVPKDIAGYIEGSDVPTYCGRCRFYEDPIAGSSACQKVEGIVSHAGCCNGYEARK